MAAVLFSSMAFIACFFVDLAAAQSDQCRQAKAFEKKMNAETPRQVDRSTELVQIRVSCEGQSLTYVKRILVSETMFNDGWQTRKQRQHTQLHCNARGIASVEGWTAIDIIYREDFSYLITFTTRPADCRK